MEVVASTANVLDKSYRWIKRSEIGALQGNEAEAAANAIEPVPAAVRVTADVKVHVVGPGGVLVSLESPSITTTV